MGNYLSAYIECDTSSECEPFTQWGQVQSLTEGSFSFYKAYKVFDALAFGRSYQFSEEDQVGRPRPLYPPRGMPSVISLDVAQDFYRLVVEPPEEPDNYFWPTSKCVSLEVARKWSWDQGSRLTSVRQWFNCGRDIEWTDWTVVSQPGLYNASWLSLSEYDAALAHHGLRLDEIDVEFSILRSAMELLVKKYGIDRVRLVIWFC